MQTHVYHQKANPWLPSATGETNYKGAQGSCMGQKCSIILIVMGVCSCRNLSNNTLKWMEFIVLKYSSMNLRGKNTVKIQTY